MLPETALTAAFLSAYVNHSGAIEDFWKDLRNRPEFRDQVGNLQFALQLGVLSGNHLPLVQELQRRKQAGEIGGLSDLALRRKRVAPDHYRAIRERPHRLPPPICPATTTRRRPGIMPGSWRT